MRTASPSHFVPASSQPTLGQSAGYLTLRFHAAVLSRLADKLEGRETIYTEGSRHHGAVEDNGQPAHAARLQRDYTRLQTAKPALEISVAEIGKPPTVFDTSIPSQNTLPHHPLHTRSLLLCL